MYTEDRNLNNPTDAHLVFGNFFWGSLSPEESQMAKTFGQCIGELASKPGIKEEDWAIGAAAQLEDVTSEFCVKVIFFIENLQTAESFDEFSAEDAKDLLEHRLSEYEARLYNVALKEAA